MRRIFSFPLEGDLFERRRLFAVNRRYGSSAPWRCISDVKTRRPNAIKRLKPCSPQ
jgi:hypothetical protein